MSEVRKLVDLHLLIRHLRRLCIIYFNIQDMMPWSGSFIVLEELILERLSREVEYLPGIDKLTRLRMLKVFGAPHLLQPRVGGSRVTKSSQPHKLESLILPRTPIKSFLGLEHLTRLRSLNCANTLLAALPDPSALKQLDFLVLGGCCRLMSLGSTGSMTALQNLHVSNCYHLESLAEAARVWKCSLCNILKCIFCLKTL